MADTRVRGVWQKVGGAWEVNVFGPKNGGQSYQVSCIWRETHLASISRSHAGISKYHAYWPFKMHVLVDIISMHALVAKNVQGIYWRLFLSILFLPILVIVRDVARKRHMDPQMTVDRQPT